MALTVSHQFFGKEAQEIVKRLDLSSELPEDHAMRRINFFYRSIEGRASVIVEFDV